MLKDTATQYRKSSAEIQRIPWRNTLRRMRRQSYARAMPTPSSTELSQKRLSATIKRLIGYLNNLAKRDSAFPPMLTFSE